MDKTKINLHKLLRHYDTFPFLKTKLIMIFFTSFPLLVLLIMSKLNANAKESYCFGNLPSLFSLYFFKAKQNPLKPKWVSLSYKDLTNSEWNKFPCFTAFSVESKFT